MSKKQITTKHMIDWLYETVHHMSTPDVEVGMAIRDFIEKHAPEKKTAS